MEFCGDPDDFCEAHPDVVVLATSITSTEAVLRGLPLTRLKRSTLFVDVLSVKEFPKKLFLSVLPPEVVTCLYRAFVVAAGASCSLRRTSPVEIAYMQGNCERGNCERARPS